MPIVKLTPEEIEERAKTLAGLEMRYEDDKELAAESAKRDREDLKELRTMILKLSREIEAGEVETDPQMEIGSGPDEPEEAPTDDHEGLPRDDEDDDGLDAEEAASVTGAEEVDL